MKGGFFVLWEKCRYKITSKVIGYFQFSKLFYTGSASSSNEISKNLISDVVEGVESIGNNQGLQIRENCINALLAGILNRSNGSLSTQGSVNSEVGNCFNFTIDDVRNFNDDPNEVIDYFVYSGWEPADCEFIDFLGNVNILDADNSSSSANCGTIGFSGGDDNLFCELPSTITGLIQVIIEFENGNGLQNEQCQQKAELALYSLFVGNENFQQGTNYFSNKTSFKNKIYALNLILESEDYPTAINFLNSLNFSNPEEQNYKRAQLIFLDYMTSEEEYELSELDYQFLKNETIHSK